MPEQTPQVDNLASVERVAKIFGITLFLTIIKF
jgi:hypothetical protein